MVGPRRLVRVALGGRFRARRPLCKRFRDELKYVSAKPWPIYERQNGGKIMYFMIHATDHPEAPKLMSRAYGRAVLPAEPVEQLNLALFQSEPHS